MEQAPPRESRHRRRTVPMGSDVAQPFVGGSSSLRLAFAVARDSCRADLNTEVVSPCRN